MLRLSFRAALLPVLLSAIAVSIADTVPTLSILRTGGNVQLSWPASATAWMPCAASDLAAPDWTFISAVPTIVNGQNVVTFAVPPGKGFYQLRHRGAVVPFTTYEAEATTNPTNGTIVKLTTLPTSTTWSPELEASGRGYVQLTNTDDHLDFPVVQAANGLVLRHCIPDAPTGGGITATLSLYVNGVFRQKLTVTSIYNWLYGDGTAGQNGSSDDPTIASATPHVFWDETRAFINGGLQAGDTLRFQKDADDTATFYRIDLVDLEAVPPPLSPPPAGTYLSIADYGANGSDANDDTAAIESCVSAATAQGKTVWFPPGTYYQTRSFTLDSITAQGAGMWYTAVIGTETAVGGSQNIGFRLKGIGASVRDLFIECSAQTTRAPGGFALLKSTTTGATLTNWSIENVWIMHTVVGLWMGGATNGTVRGCRVRNTYADGIHFAGGASNSLMEHNHVRGSGDDGIATLSDAQTTISTNNTLRFNTVIANWTGHNCDVAGGSGHVVEDNYFADNFLTGCFTISLPSAFPMHPLTGATIRRNTMVRGGGNQSGQKRGAIWINPGAQTISGVFIRDNDIRDPIFRGIHLAGTQSQSITFERNVVDHPGENGVHILSSVIGNGTFNNNIVRNLNATFLQFSNGAATPGYTVTLSGNTW